MDRSALLKLIHKDINELQLLLQGMEGYNDIPEPIIKLAKNKALQLQENIHELPGEVLVPLTQACNTEKADPISDEPESSASNQSPSHVDFESEITEETSVEPNNEPVLDASEELFSETEETNTEEIAINEFVADETIEDETSDETSEISVEPNSLPATDKPKSKAVFGETIVSGEKVFDRIKNDISNSLSARLEGSPIKDLKRGININDKFMFQKELFGNNSEGLNACIDAVNDMSSFDEALTFMLDHYEWNYDDDITKRFVSLVNRRYK